MIGGKQTIGGFAQAIGGKGEMMCALITSAEEEVGFWRAGARCPIPLQDRLQDLLEVFGEVRFQDKQVGAAGEGGFDIPGCSGERLDDDRDMVPFPV